MTFLIARLNHCTDLLHDRALRIVEQLGRGFDARMFHDWDLPEPSPAGRAARDETPHAG